MNWPFNSFYCRYLFLLISEVNMVCFLQNSLFCLLEAWLASVLRGDLNTNFRAGHCTAFNALLLLKTGTILWLFESKNIKLIREYILFSIRNEKITKLLQCFSFRYDDGIRLLQNILSESFKSRKKLYIYTFLHRKKGTAGSLKHSAYNTIIYNISDKLNRKPDSQPQKEITKPTWKKKTVKIFLIWVVISMLS